MKKYLYPLTFTFFLTACGSKSSIITSKSVAVKKKIYANDKAKTIIIEKQIAKPEAVVAKKNEPKIELKAESKIKSLFEKKDETLPDTIDEEFVLNAKDPLRKNEQNEDIYEENPTYNSALSEKIVSVAIDNIGTRYRSGGTTQSGFDCSGLMIASFSKFDIKLPRTSNDMSRFGKKINPKNALKGDLIFFRTLGNRNINHVGMVVEVNDDEIKFVHSSIKRGVIVSTTKEGYYKKTFAQVNRVLE